MKTPEPCLVRRRLAAAVVEVNCPENVEEVSARPMVSVVAVPPGLVTRPAPASEPMTWELLLRLSVAPAATVSAVRLGRTFAALATSEPALMVVAPLWDEVEPRRKMPASFLTRLPPVMKPPAETSTSPAPAMTISERPDRRPPAKQT